MQPSRPPIGLALTQAARTVGRAFDVALAEAGGSLPLWLVLLQLKVRPTANQREIAEAIGLTEATLTHHMNAMEKDGLLTRRRDPDNRRVHVVELTSAGDALFHRLRAAAVAFDRRVRRGMSEGDVESLRALLDRMAGNVA